MRINGQIECPGCKLKTPITNVKAPQKVEPTLITLRCENCLSDVMAKLFVAKGQNDRTKVQIAARITRASETLIQLLKEEKEYRDSPEAQTGQH